MTPLANIWNSFSKVFLFAFALILCSPPSLAQVSLKAHLGASYIEHLATGITVSYRHHSVTALYGSNLFINTRNFSNLFAQYDYSVPRWKVAGAIPRFGVKGGNSIYTNKYYRWKVVSLIPFAGARYPVNDKLEVLFEVGPTYSFEQHLERIKYGEIGHYRYVLLELKVAVAYTLFTGHKL
ncbi:MAG TPA: hypothetical protein VK508_08980 [Cyclobacteriaceae bacterium]|nr:hypothetical protein [Cyclobacteriaceae bacterium]